MSLLDQADQVLKKYDVLDVPNLTAALQGSRCSSEAKLDLKLRISRLCYAALQEAATPQMIDP